jgi:hypothetical protein
MKSKFLLLLTMAGAVSAGAQTEKGNFLLGAGVANATAAMVKGGDAVDYFGISISPRAGYFLAKNFVVGTGIGLGYQTMSTAHQFSVGFEPFARYYVGSGKTKFYAEGSIGYHRHMFSSRPVGPAGTPHTPRPMVTNSFSFGPGVTHFITPNVGLEAGLLFKGTKENSPMPRVFMPSLNVGFNIYLNRSKRNSEKEEN